MTARRTLAAGSRAAFATASLMMLASAPWRISPHSKCARKSCSSGVALPNRSRSPATRPAVEPGPLRPATRVSAASTSASDRPGAGAGGAAHASRTAAKPTPIRPWGSAPHRYATAISMSGGAVRARNAASRSILSSRPGAARRPRDVATRSNSMPQVTVVQTTGGPCTPSVRGVAGPPVQVPGRPADGDRRAPGEGLPFYSTDRIDALSPVCSKGDVTMIGSPGCSEAPAPSAAGSFVLKVMRWRLASAATNSTGST